MMRRIKRLVRRVTGRMPATPWVGSVRFGDFRRLEPFCRDYGYNRGLPVDRYYIEGFLSRHGKDIRGNVLEIGERAYTEQFGTAVAESHMLHYSNHEGATYVDDLTTGKSVPDNMYDCVIFTQTLHLIYDMKSAIETLYRILKPGGILLCTVPGITQISDNEWNPNWYWSLSPVSAKRLFGEVFADEDLEIECHGNMLAAISFLAGLAYEELTPRELDHKDVEYPVIVAIAARKGAAAAG
jgi:SAM-dependent methyltransferase